MKRRRMGEEGEALMNQNDVVLLFSETASFRGERGNRLSIWENPTLPPPLPDLLQFGPFLISSKMKYL